MKYCGSLQTARVMDYLYDDSTVYLERKYQKLKTYLNSRSKQKYLELRGREPSLQGVYKILYANGISKIRLNANKLTKKA